MKTYVTLLTSANQTLQNDKLNYALLAETKRLYLTVWLVLTNNDIDSTEQDNKKGQSVCADTLNRIVKQRDIEFINDHAHGYGYLQERIAALLAVALRNTHSGFLLAKTFPNDSFIALLQSVPRSLDFHKESALCVYGLFNSKNNNQNTFEVICNSFVLQKMFGFYCQMKIFQPEDMKAMQAYIQALVRKTQDLNDFWKNVSSRKIEGPSQDPKITNTPSASNVIKPDMSCFFL